MHRDMARPIRGRNDEAAGAERAPAVTPVWVAELDLSDPPQRLLAPEPPDGGAYATARLLVRLQREPLGLMTAPVARGEVDVETTVLRARARFAARIEAQLGPDWRSLLESTGPTLSTELASLDGDDLPGVSVVIGTKDRPDHVATCVAHVLKQSYRGALEVIVVDNAPSTDATRRGIADLYSEDARVRYVLEPRKGLSRARNIGLAAARHELVAFVSDDIRVDSTWLRAIVRGFRRHADVGCVMGYCPPLFLDTHQQQVFEQQMGWGWRNGFEPILAGGPGAADTHPLHPYLLGLGTGANVAFATAELRATGGFDEALGPGTIARGGEDLAAIVDVLVAGRRAAFEPAALGWHADRYDDRDFDAHMYTYGVGLTAFLTGHMLRPDTRRALLAAVPRGIRHLARPAILPATTHELEPVNERPQDRLANLAGRVMGPAALLRSRASTRRHRTSGPVVPPTHATPPNPPETMRTENSR